MPSSRDTYQIWKDTGKLKEVIEFIVDCSTKMVTQQEMAKHLGITTVTMSHIRKKHPDIDEAVARGKLDLKRLLMNQILKLALGYEYTEESQLIEDEGKGKPPKRKITKNKKYVKGDKYCAIYLLTKNFAHSRLLYD